MKLRIGKLLPWSLRRRGRKWFDDLQPKGEALQIRLKKKGQPDSGIYKDDQREIRSPNLDEVKPDAPQRSDDR